MHRPVRLLTAVPICDGHDSAINTLNIEFIHHGIEVERCHDLGRPAFPCNAFIPGKVCPLDAGFDVVVTARARPSRVVEPGEIGVVCALRTGRPLIVAGLSAHNPFGATAAEVVPEEGDLAKACHDAVGLVSTQAGATEEVVDLRGLRT